MKGFYGKLLSIDLTDPLFDEKIIEEEVFEQYFFLQDIVVLPSGRTQNRCFVTF